MYGSFECEASFANGIGSWPAFWSFHNKPCQNNEGPEIDFAEYFCWYNVNQGKKLGHFIHHWICNGGGEEDTDYEAPKYVFYATTNIYKCIWTPEKIEFYVDNVKKVTYENNGEDWFPYQAVRVIVSQQILQPKSGGSVVAPQTSYFDYVHVKKFFLAPEITISSDVICTSDTATLDVDDDATNISWSLSPTYLFSGATTGTGTNASVSVSNYNGEGKITYSFKMGDETFTAEKTFWVGEPKVYSLSNHLVDINTGMPMYNFCYGTHNDVEAVHPAGDAHIIAWEWRVTGGTVYPYGAQYRYATIYPNSYSNFMVEIRARNTCDRTDWARMWTEVVNCGGYYMMISPNPTTGETTLSIESDSEEKTVDENTEWELEIYSPTQTIKEKRTKLKGNSTQIQTAGWKEGVYVVRVKYKDEILTGKLVVKK